MISCNSFNLLTHLCRAVRGCKPLSGRAMAGGFSGRISHILYLSGMGGEDINDATEQHRKCI